eukprot:3032871-Pyramimonas_sp.AAC.1
MGILTYFCLPSSSGTQGAGGGCEVEPAPLPPPGGPQHVCRVRNGITGLQSVGPHPLPSPHNH